MTISWIFWISRVPIEIRYRARVARSPRSGVSKIQEIQEILSRRQLPAIGAEAVRSSRRRPCVPLPSPEEARAVVAAFSRSLGASARLALRRKVGTPAKHHESRGCHGVCVLVGGPKVVVNTQLTVSMHLPETAFLEPEL